MIHVDVKKVVTAPTAAGGATVNANKMSGGLLPQCPRLSTAVPRTPAVDKHNLLRLLIEEVRVAG